MSFVYKDFISTIHSKYKKDFSIEEIKELLSVDDDYERDNSHGKRLTINHLKFKGNKTNKQEFEFDKPFDLGVNVIIADNLKGKSSILKLIKFCLTGSSKIRDDIQSWIKEIWLEFSINDSQYTVHIDISGRQKSDLYKMTLKEFLSNKNLDEKRIFSSNSTVNFVEEMENFFFDEFEFYNLQWTQKDSRKDSNKINTSNASWKTYYSYLNLESKDSGVMFYGGQTELSYQMLLGLKLTYPINRLKIKKERKEYNLSLLSNRQDVDLKAIEKNIMSLKKERIVLDKKLKEKSISQSVNISNQLLKDRSILSTKIEGIQKKNIETNERLLKLDKELKKCNSTSTNNVAEIKTLEHTYNKTLKKINDLKEYLDIGIFFTNLDIQVCPHCYHDVDEEKKTKEKENKECMLCNHLVEEPLTDKENYLDKIKELEHDLTQIKTQISLYQNKNLELQKESQSIVSESEQIKESLLKLKSEENKLTENHRDIGEKIIVTSEQESQSNKDKLETQKELAIINYRIEEEEKKTKINPTKPKTKYDQEISLLNEAIETLKSIRINENKVILLELEDLILQELKDLGIPSVEEVKIEENFKIKFKINDVYSEFDDVSEGEQLRVKLAFYLGLIQLNIQSGYGKHPRFLIIDSPAKEEGDKNYVEGLIKVIEDVTKKYKTDLQIIICSAQRELDGIKINGQKYVYPEGEFLF